MRSQQNVMGSNTRFHPKRRQSPTSIGEGKRGEMDKFAGNFRRNAAEGLDQTKPRESGIYHVSTRETTSNTTT